MGETNLVPTMLAIIRKDHPSYLGVPIADTIEQLNEYWCDTLNERIHYPACWCDINKEINEIPDFNNWLAIKVGDAWKLAYKWDFDFLPLKTTKNE